MNALFWLLAAIINAPVPLDGKNQNRRAWWNRFLCEVEWWLFPYSEHWNTEPLFLHKIFKQKK